MDFRTVSAHCAAGTPSAGPISQTALVASRSPFPVSPLSEIQNHEHTNEKTPGIKVFCLVSDAKLRHTIKCKTKTNKQILQKELSG